MSQIEFLFNGCRTLIQCQYSDKFEEVLEKLRFKIGINLDSVYYLYSGKVLKSKGGKKKEFSAFMVSIIKHNQMGSIQLFHCMSLSTTLL